VRVLAPLVEEQGRADVAEVTEVRAKLREPAARVSFGEPQEPAPRQHLPAHPPANPASQRQGNVRSNNTQL
jgi:hypothetical protein